MKVGEGLLQGTGSGLRYGHFLRVNEVKEERLQTRTLVFPEYKQDRSVPVQLKLKSKMWGRNHLNHAEVNVCVCLVGWWLGRERGENKPCSCDTHIFAIVFKPIILLLQFLVFLWCNIIKVVKNNSRLSTCIQLSRIITLIFFKSDKYVFIKLQQQKWWGTTHNTTIRHMHMDSCQFRHSLLISLLLKQCNVELLVRRTSQK